MFKALCFFAVLAVAFAQTPQTGPLSITTVTPGAVVSGTLLPVVASLNYHVDLYSVYIPENVSSVNFTFTDTADTACSYLSVYLSTFGIPCSSDEYSYSYYQCANAWDVGSGIDDYTTILNPYDNSGLYHYDVNQNWYLAVGRYYSSDYDETCTYQFSFNYNTTCAAGSVGVATGSSSTVCAAYTTVNTSNTYTILNGNPTGNTDFTVFKVNVPTPTVGHIYVRVNSTSSDLDLYGRNYAGASTYTDYVCYEYTYTTVGNFYIYDMFCYTPRQGDFFITIDTDDVNWNGTVTFDMLTCGAGTAGVNCTFPLFPFNTTALTAPYTFPIPYTGGSSVEYGSVYFYWDIPANYTGGQIVMYATSAQSGYFVIRRNGFPTSDSSSGYEYSSQYDTYDAVLALNQFDYQVGGRLYMLLNCYSSTGCNVTVSLNATSGSTSSAVTTGTPLPTPTTGVPTPTPTTGLPTPTPTTGLRFTTGLTTSQATTGAGMMTTGAQSESSAIAIVPSVVALAAALFAML